MTEGVSDVLEVLVLAKQAGLTGIDATPLFETQVDLERAPGILDTLFQLPAYRRHVEERGVQEVMIGYSDSNKDAGFLAANWALYQAQEGIAAVCRQAGIPLRLFHGRGTSIGRGGGPTGQAILAQPPGSLNGRMRLTEQGEALSERYADPDLAHRHLEQVAHAFILSSARDTGTFPELSPDYRKAMTRASIVAKDHYRALLETEGFLDFYHTVTPIEEISQLNIGSRPARRKGDPSLENLRAIPWVFSWTQCRANLPGWFGLGTGLAVLQSDLLREMYANWPFFKTMIDFAQMSLAKADLGIFESYLELVPSHLTAEFWPRIRQEFDRAVAQIEVVTGSDLLDHDPTLARGIELRNPYVDPISYLQVELLKRLRSSMVESTERDGLEYAVQVSLVGVSAGVRNTG
jgi:phosphoenolpyruvate carboxylase